MVKKTKKTPFKLSQYFNKKKITDPHTLRVLITVLTILTLSFILCSKYFSFQSVIKNGRIQRDIVATRSIVVEDKKATQLNKEEALSKVKPVYKPVASNYDAMMMNDLKFLLEDFAEVRQNIEKSKDKRAKLNQIYNKEPFSSLSKNIVQYLLVDASDYNWNIIQSQSQQILNSVLKQGVSANDLLENKLTIIRTYLPRTISLSNRNAIIALVDKALSVPNLIIDEQATDVAQRNALDVVDKVMVYYKKGDVIAKKAQRPTPVQIEALNKLGYTVNKINWLVMFGILCCILISVYAVWYYISRYEPEYADSPKHLALLAMLSTFTLALALLISSLNNNFYLPMYLIQLPAITLIIAMFTSPRVGLLIAALTAFLISVVFNVPVEDLSVMAIGTIAAVLKFSKLKHYKDSSLIECGMAVGFAQVIVVISSYLIINSTAGGINFNEILYISAMAATGFLTGGFTIAALPHMEALFKIVTNHGLIELADQNQPLLRRLQFEAPGTYHHSLMVSTLSEAAAEAIGASTILVKVGAFYHDIGKLKRPSFFIENQYYFGSENPHDKLNPRLSKMVLSAHTKDGLELARQYNIPDVICNLIVAHHGDGIMQYFYRAALEAEGPEKVLKEQFRYMGPKPTSKESAIIMLADATESAVRSLKNPNPTAIEEMVMKIINERLHDGQLSDTPLTMKDLQTIATNFIRVLRGMQHHRIEYQENMLQEFGKRQIEQNKQLTKKPEDPSSQNGNTSPPSKSKNGNGKEQIHNEVQSQQ